VPDVFKDDIALNARIAERRGDFVSPEVAEKPSPRPEEVLLNKRRWGYEG
jgi:hypothetical protein